MPSWNDCGASWNMYISAEFSDSIVSEGPAALSCASFCILGLKEYHGVGGCSGTVATSGSIVCIPLYFEGAASGSLGGGIIWQGGVKVQMALGWWALLGVGLD